MSTRTGKEQLRMAVALIAILIGLGVVILLSTPGAENHDLPENREVFTLFDTYNMTVVVSFDNEPPAVQFISPNGSLVDMGSIRYRPGGNFVQYFLPNAMPGAWQMAYDPLSNIEITTHYSVYMAHIFIRDFAADVVSDGNGDIPITFKVSADEPDEFNYQLYAVFTAPDNSIADEILLAQGYGQINETHNLLANISEIDNKNGFMLRLTASVQHGQAAIADTSWLDLRLSSIHDYQTKYRILH